jgi:prephenate dehydrogenase
MKPKIAIVGLGLIGGSLGMALKKKGLARVLGLTSDKEKADHAAKIHAVDFASTNIKGIVQDCEIIFICYPIHLVLPEIQKIIQFVRPGTIITDVGSTKEMIVSKAEKLMPKGVTFIGGHPMAGKEVNGLDAAEADMFKGCNYVLTKTPRTDAKSLKTIKSLIDKLGAKTIIMDPSEHDTIVAGISHLPVAVASALVASVMDAGQLSDDMKRMAASGFRDTTRVASGDPDLGADMFTTNKKEVLNSLKRFKKSLSEIEWMIRLNNIDGIKQKLRDAKTFRDSMCK